MTWKYKAVIGVGEFCDIPGCDDPVDAVFVLVDEDEPNIQTAVRVCATHLAESWEDREEILRVKAPWN